MRYLILLLLLNACLIAAAQKSKNDSLIALIEKTKNDTARIRIMNTLNANIMENNLDSSIVYSKKIIEESKRLRYIRGEAVARRMLGEAMIWKGNFDEAKTQINQAEKLIRSINDSGSLQTLYSSFGLLYGMQSNYDSSIFFYQQSIRLGESLSDKKMLTKNYQNIAIGYQMKSDFRQTMYYETKALQLAEALKDTNTLAYICVNMGITYESLDDKKRSEDSYLKAVRFAKAAGIKNVELYTYANLSSLYQETKEYTKSYDYAMQAVSLGKQTGDSSITSSNLARAALDLANLKRFSEAETLQKEAVTIVEKAGQPLTKYQVYSVGGSIKKIQGNCAEAIPLYEKAFSFINDEDSYAKSVGLIYQELSECYEVTGNMQKALASFKKATVIKDSISSRDNVRKATELGMTYEFDKKQETQRLAKEKEDRENRIKLIFLIAFLLVFITLSTVALFAFRREKKAKTIANEQKKQTEETLVQLKTTQSQLIHAEKMASLGELTAGIAHEIQNPLNFVNNFSEVNNELIDEMDAENDMQEIKAIANDIKQNNEKITFHGKRADAIVKGMLQHSRKNTGQKEPTDINALCDEYLRLSYHGLRAKDKSFSANFTTDFDETISKINLVPQDIGRVLLNLFNNAFYAVNEKKKTAGEEYKPVVSVQTQRTSEQVEIKVNDNGKGIPQNILDKIFQPFFTTKPTGEGTGLGLSMSYDIITKGHGGTIKVESEENSFTRFTIALPTT